MNINTILCLLSGHEWNELIYESANSCKKFSRCKRCHKKRHHDGYFHEEWSEWKYESADSCIKYSVCKRCQGKNTSRSACIWGEPQYQSESSCEKIVKCIRCNFRDNNAYIPAEHQWVIHMNPKSKCEGVKKCKRCKWTLEYDEHEWDTIWETVEEECPHSDSHMNPGMCYYCGNMPPEEHGEAICKKCKKKKTW